MKAQDHKCHHEENFRKKMGTKIICDFDFWMDYCPVSCLDQQKL